MFGTNLRGCGPVSRILANTFVHHRALLTCRRRWDPGEKNFRRCRRLPRLRGRHPVSARLRPRARTRPERPHGDDAPFAMGQSWGVSARFRVMRFKTPQGELLDHGIMPDIRAKQGNGRLPRAPYYYVEATTRMGRSPAARCCMSPKTLSELVEVYAEGLGRAPCKPPSRGSGSSSSADHATLPSRRGGNLPHPRTCAGRCVTLFLARLDAAMWAAASGPCSNQSACSWSK